MGGNPLCSAISQLSFKTVPFSSTKTGNDVGDAFSPLILELFEKLREPFFATLTEIDGRIC
jgi:hypothetical protein